MKYKYAFIIFIIIAVWLWMGGLSNIICQYKARDCYLKSRGSGVKPGSYEFITRGIKYNMKEDAVRKIMHAANKKIKLIQSSPPWDGTAYLYIFHYGPQWKEPFKNHKKYLYREWVRVYFDPNGCAKKMDRDLFAGPSCSSEEIDLKHRRIKKQY